MVDKSNQQYWRGVYPRLANDLGPVDGRQVNLALMRLKRLRYGGRDIGGPYWISPRGNKFYFDALPAPTDNSMPDEDDTDNNYAGTYGYQGGYGNEGDNVPDYGDRDYTGNTANQGSTPAAIVETAPITHNENITAKNHLWDGPGKMHETGWDDIPNTAGLGKYSKQSIKKAALNMPCVQEQISRGRAVKLRRNNTIDGKPHTSEETIVAGDRSLHEPPVVVTFTGDLRSDGSQAAGKKAKLQADCEDTTTTGEGASATGEDGCRPCCDDCGHDTSERPTHRSRNDVGDGLHREHLRNPWKAPATAKNPVVDKQVVVDKWGVVRNPQRVNYADMGEVLDAHMNLASGFDGYSAAADAETSSSGLKIRTIIIGKDGREMPEGTTLDYYPIGDLNKSIPGHEDHLRYHKIVAGTRVVKEPTGEGAMDVWTLTYRYHWGNSADVLELWNTEHHLEYPNDTWDTPLQPISPIWPQPVMPPYNPAVIQMVSPTPTPPPVPHTPPLPTPPIIGPISFGMNSAVPVLTDPITRRAIRRVLAKLTANPALTLTITADSGYPGSETDPSTFIDEFGRKRTATIRDLMLARAAAIRNILIGNGIDRKRITRRAGRTFSRREITFGFP